MTKTEHKLIERIKFHACLGFTQLDRSTGTRMRQAAIAMADKGWVVIEFDRYEPEIWTIRVTNEGQKAMDIKGDL